MANFLNKNLFLSICIPTYQPTADFARTNYFKNAVNSIVSQDNGKIELVVLDQSPHKRVAELICKLENPLIRYIRNPEKGYGNNLRACMNEAHGNYVMLFNDDDLLLEGSIEKIFNFLNEYPTVSVVTRGFALFRKNKKNNDYSVILAKDKLNCDAIIREKEAKINTFWIGDACVGFLSGLILRRQDALKAGNFAKTGNFSQFKPVLKMLLDINLDGGYINDYLVAAREHETNLGSLGEAYEITIEMLNAYENIEQLKRDSPTIYRTLVDFLIYANLMLIPKNRLHYGFIRTIVNIALLIKMNLLLPIKCIRFWSVTLLSCMPVGRKTYERLLRFISDLHFNYRASNCKKNNQTEATRIIEYIKKIDSGEKLIIN